MLKWQMWGGVVGNVVYAGCLRCLSGVPDGARSGFWGCQDVPGGLFGGVRGCQDGGFEKEGGRVVFTQGGEERRLSC